MKRLARIAALSVLCLLWVLPAAGQRRITPVNTAATATQSLNELKDDTAHINARRRARSSSYVNDAGMVVWVDTLTGDQWVDSMAPRAGIPKMQYGLLHSVSVGVDIWDAAMRLFGQDFGLVGFSAELNMHNRYIPVFEAGLGTAAHRPSGMGYNYRSPMAPYFRIGANYNFLYNSNPSYMFVAGLRYGFSAFNWEVNDITVESPYWDETATASIPSQKATAGWLEICFGLRVKLAGPISAGWMLKYHSMLHCTSGTHGSPYYVPGYGARNGALTGAFYITYTLPFRHKPKDLAPDTDIEK
ncbi:MAG: hypothetical protein K2F72_00525 [Muribaculaceae bacterium]|nr:hypothetical protein [Muribaculaceae bacterium]